MKALVFSLMILVSCGKDPVKKPSSAPVEAKNNMALTDLCIRVPECVNTCTGTHDSCLNGCGRYRGYLTEEMNCRSGCDSTYSACINKEVEIPQQ
jgi:hypothetical protein